MTNAQTAILRYAGRNPRRAVRIGLMTTAALGTVSRARAAKHYAGAAVDPVKRASADARVHREARRSVRHLNRSLRHAQRIGAVNALNDRRVSRELRIARRHASRAAQLTLSPPRHRLRRAALIVAGAGVGVATIAAARRATRREMEPATTSAPVEAPAAANAPDTAEPASADEPSTPPTAVNATQTTD